MKKNHFFAILFSSSVAFSCVEHKEEKTSANTEIKKTEDFLFKTEQFADIKILRYQVPGFDELSLKQKELLYYLYEAANAGRDITWDQHFKHNLCIRKTLEGILNSYNGDTASAEFSKFLVYTKRVWFSNGIHHHYSNSKFIPDFSKEYFAELIKNSDQKLLPLSEGENLDAFISKLTPIIFDPALYSKRVDKDPSKDMVKSSATNFYEGLTQKEVETYYHNLSSKKSDNPISYGLNSKLIKENGKIVEKVWKVGGMYSKAIEKIVFWLEKAVSVAENELQKDALSKLVKFYKSGELKDFDEYNIAWVKDTDSRIDVVNGFIEVYGDPMGFKGSFESVVSIRDMEASKRIQAISKEAQWFEDNSSLIPEHKKKSVQGISAKVITAVVESGDAAPATPIGINLPNADWIRKVHGSKSVNLGNIVTAAEEASKVGKSLLTEFGYSEDLIKNQKQYGAYADLLHTDMHEVIGHASGQLNPGIGQPHETLKNYASTLEEARADLVALYYLMDKKLIDIGVMESLEVGKAGYDDYIMNGLMTQLTRLKLGDDIEEDHMRNRQLVAAWVYEKGKAENVIERKDKDGKTFFVINDYLKLKDLFGQLLREIQRIKSEGDYKSAKALVETYGVKVDQKLHAEVLKRFESLGLAPYSGFINPKLVPVMQGDKIIDVKLEIPTDFREHMLYLGKNHSFLPVYN